MSNFQLDIEGSPQYYLIKTDAEYKELLRKVKTSPICSWDYETFELTNSWWEENFARKKRGLDVWNTFIAGASFSFEHGTAYYIPINHKPPTRNFNYEQMKNLILAIPPTAKVVCHNLFYEALITKWCLGIDIPGELWDTMLMAFNIDENRYVNLKGLAKREFGIKMPTYSQTINQAATDDDEDEPSMADITGEEARIYGCADADVTGMLFSLYWQELEALDLLEYTQELDMKMIPILVQMFLDGASFDEEAWRLLMDEDENRRIELINEIIEEVGHDFNLNSPKQLAEVLFDELGLPSTVETDSGGRSTNILALTNLFTDGKSGAVVKKVVECRQLTKRIGAFYDTLPKFVHPDTGKIHSQVSLISREDRAISTGRLASSKPNLMQQPKRGKGRKVRKMFVPHADLGHDLLLAPDWSQIELRILGYFARPAKFLEVYREGKDDLHTLTGRRIFKEGLTKELRDVVAKATNFLIIYGGGASKLRDTINKGAAQSELAFRVTVAQAERYINDYFSLYPEVETYMNRQITFARKYGYVESMFGRHFNLPFIKSRNRELKGKAERKAVNSVIQGSAAELMKLSMIRIWTDPRFQDMYQSDLVRIIQPIHDELLFSLNSVILQPLHELVYKHMVTPPPGFDIPLESEAKVGKNFCDLIPYEKWMAEHAKGN